MVPLFVLQEYVSLSRLWWGFFPRLFFLWIWFWFFFGICKTLTQFGSYKYACPRVSLSGDCTSLSSGETSKSTGPRPTTAGHPGLPGCSRPSWAPAPRCPQPHRAGPKGWGSPLLILCWLHSMPQSLFFPPFFPGVKGRDSQPSALACGVVIKEE